MRQVQLPSGEAVPALGLGTWRMGENASARSTEVAAIRYAYEQGVRLFDTAEMYGEGGAEEILGEALKGARDDCFIVSKIYPHNAGREDARAACERSLRRLGSDRIDLYLLHWPGPVSYGETVDIFETLRAEGKIRHYGVSNLDADDMAGWFAAGGTACAANQVLYNLMRRGPEFDLLPWCAAHGIPVMAYSPLEQGRRFGGEDTLDAIADKHDVTAMQIALAWILRDPNVIAIPKSVRPAHIDNNLAALEIRLDDDDLARIDTAFPPPTRKTNLEML